MDQGLRSEWQTFAVVPVFDWIRSSRRQFEISLGAALATRTRGSARVRSPTSSWAIDTNGRCLPGRIVRPRLDRVSPFHFTIETIFSRATLCGAVFGSQNGTKSA